MCIGSFISKQHGITFIRYIEELSGTPAEEYAVFTSIMKEENFINLFSEFMKKNNVKKNTT